MNPNTPLHTDTLSLRVLFCNYLTCGQNLLVEATNGGHGDGSVSKETDQAEVTRVSKLDALLTALLHALTLQHFIKHLNTIKRREIRYL